MSVQRRSSKNHTPIVQCDTCPVSATSAQQVRAAIFRKRLAAKGWSLLGDQDHCAACTTVLQIPAKRSYVRKSPTNRRTAVTAVTACVKSTQRLAAPSAASGQPLLTAEAQAVHLGLAAVAVNPQGHIVWCEFVQPAQQALGVFRCPTPADWSLEVPDGQVLTCRAHVGVLLAGRPMLASHRLSAAVAR